MLGNALVLVPPALLLFGHQLDQLSLLKEYHNRQEVFDAALLQHLTILLATMRRRWRSVCRSGCCVFVPSAGSGRSSPC
ncbi:hypothetical protein AK51_28110 [Serratia nematodiphila DZ0503SBS1]|nr:hypothetical protein AK51_28110 [Serratia nematodiphila DZ0503SBS1]